MAAGVFSCRTCFKTVRIPAPYLHKLAVVAYPTSDFPSFFDAFDYWVFTELLNAIGNHNMA